MEKIEIIWRRAKAHADRHGHPEHSEDFAQEASLQIAMGRKATIKQLFIDYLRAEFGRSGTPGGRARQLAKVRTISLDAPLSEDPTGAQYHDIIGSFGGEPDIDREDMRIESLFGVKELDLYREYFKDEITMKEMGEARGITESRVSQLLRPVKGKIELYHMLFAALDKLKHDEAFGRFEVDWISL